MLAQILLIPKSSYLSRFEALCNSSLKTFLNWLPCFLVVFFFFWWGWRWGGVCVFVCGLSLPRRSPVGNNVWGWNWSNKQCRWSFFQQILWQAQNLCKALQDHLATSPVALSPTKPLAPPASTLSLTWG